MNEHTHEQLSAFMDGELESEPARFLVRSLLQNAGVRARWERYHLIREALHRGLPRGVDAGFADRVYGALSRESGRRRFALPAVVTRPLAGLAVAAAVATVAVLGFQYSGPPSLHSTPAPIASTAPAGSAGYEPAAVQRVDAARLNAYLVNHSEYARGAGMGDMLSYVRIVGYDPGSGAGRR
ncbi:anti-sigma-E factor RseA [bacterium BMS3Bbin12]|nr:anti-sigma-E factor RseA [bacterium BMS3Bbin12]HDO33927.1 hypothetical protein [Chromatiales bacterium]